MQQTSVLRNDVSEIYSLSSLDQTEKVDCFLSLLTLHCVFFDQIDSVSEEVDRQRSICDMVSPLNRSS